MLLWNCLWHNFWAVSVSRKHSNGACWWGPEGKAGKRQAGAPGERHSKEARSSKLPQHLPTGKFDTNFLFYAGFNNIFPISVIFVTFFMRLLSYSRKWNSISMCWCKIITSQRTFGYNNKICWIIFTVERHFPGFYSSTKVAAANVIDVNGRQSSRYANINKSYWHFACGVVTLPQIYSTRRPLLQNFRCWFIVFFSRVTRFQPRLAIILIELWSFYSL